MKATLAGVVIGLWALLAAPGGSCAPAKSLSSAECERFARELETQFANGNPGFYLNAHDPGLMLDRIFPPGSPERRAFQSGEDVFNKNFRTGLERAIRGTSSIKFIRIRESANERFALVRLVFKDSGFNYAEYAFAKNAAGDPKIVDAYLYGMGEKQSDTVRRMLLPFAREKNKKYIGRLFSETSDIVKHENEWVAVLDNVRQNKFRDAMRLYVKLPPSLQKEKFLIVMQLQSAEAIGDERSHNAALELWSKTYPDDPALDLLRLTSCWQRKQFDKVHEALTRLDKSIGGDPFLDYKRAVVFGMTKEADKAHDAAVRAFEGDPTLLESGLFAVSIRAGQGRYSDCASLLSKLQSTGGYTKQRLANEIETSTRYAQLTVSREYMKWHGPRLAPANLIIKGRETGGKGSGLKLQTIVRKNSGSLASFGGQEVSLGDTLGDFKVVEIGPESVTVESWTGEKKVVQIGEILEAPGWQAHR